MKQVKNQFGRTMVEMLAVLAIIGVLTVGAIAGLSQALDKYKTGKLHDDILSIDSAIVDLYAWQRRYPTYSEGNTTMMNTLCSNRVFPDGCINSSKAKHIYGGEYKISMTAHAVTIKATGLPADVCLNLAGDDMDWGEYLTAGTNNPVCSAGTFIIVFD